MQTNVCAAGKVILFGEHFVVYGAPGIVAAIEPYNWVEMNITQGDALLDYKTTQASSYLKQTPRECTNSPHPIAALYCHYVREYEQMQNLQIIANVKKVWELKGVGNSASLSACFSHGIRQALNLSLDKKEIIKDVQIAEAAAHGTPSGIDASAVVYGGILKFRKGIEIENLEFSIPSNFSFLIIDTYKKDAERSNTKEMIVRFAKTNSIDKPPNELSQEQKDEINSKYLKIYKSALDALKRADAQSLADAMNKNHELIKEAASSPSIELAIKIALENGAIGAKLTGAGGVGGTVVVLCNNEKIHLIVSALEKEGFGTHEFNISKKGIYKK